MVIHLLRGQKSTERGIICDILGVGRLLGNPFGIERLPRRSLAKAGLAFSASDFSSLLLLNSYFASVASV
jgi:hypothetical protein